MTSNTASATSMKNFDLDFLGFFVPNLQSFYDILSEIKGFYLPKFDSKCITEEYLLSVAKKQVFTISKDKIKFGSLKTKKFRTDLMEILQGLTQLPLGFTEEHYPNKRWLINCIYSLNPLHKIFQTPYSGFTRELPAK